MPPLRCAPSVWPFVALACVALLPLAGCSQSPRGVDPPYVDPDGASTSAMAKYDADGTGQIEGVELDKAVALKAALAKLDQNIDGKVTAQEIANRIKGWRDSKVGVTSVSCRVQIDGKPVQGVVITLLPETFLGNEIKASSGKSGSQGFATLCVDDPAIRSRGISGAHCGFYVVQIDGPGVPAQYVDSNSPLGVEVAQDADWMQSGLVFKLRSQGASRHRK